MTDVPRVAAPAGDAVHVWTVDLDVPCVEYGELRSLLDAAEVARADRFVFERDGRRYVVGRGMLRLLLAAYLRVPPRAIDFSYGDRGKPALRRGHGALEFNLSHAAGVAVYAMTGGAAIGVDVECSRRTVEFAALASRFFSAEEASELLALDPDAQRQAFFNCWTRKEAYIKAIGDGLACPLDAFSVTLQPGEPARMRSIGGDRAEARGWTLHAFEASPDYFGAFAVRAPIREVVLRDAREIFDARRTWRAASLQEALQ
jgi:4'-phosphopantetheinyl transferase